LGGWRGWLFVVPVGRTVDRVWAETAECAADEFAAHKSPVTALNLASALVTIAKMVPSGKRAEVPLGAYLVGAEETQGVKSRIRRLIEMSSNSSVGGNSNSLVRLLPFISFLGFAILATI